MTSSMLYRILDSVGVRPKCPHCHQLLQHDVLWQSRITCSSCGNAIADSNTYRLAVVAVIYVVSMMLYRHSVVALLVVDLLVLWLAAKYARLEVVKGKSGPD